MNKKLLPMGVALCWLTVATVVFFSLWHPSDHVSSLLNSPRPPVRAQIDQSKKKESVRLVTYKGDSDVAVSAHIVYVNGDIEDIAYEADGQTYLNDTVRTADGSLKKFGLRLHNGDFETTIYKADQHLVVEHTIVDLGDSLVSAQYWHDNGVLAKTVRHTGNDTMVTTSYREDGTLSSQSSANVYSGRYVDVFYRADGKSVSAKFVTDTTETTGYYYRLDGSLSQKRSWDYDSTMTVVIYGAHNQALYTQLWLPDWLSANGADARSPKLKYTLQSVDVLRGPSRGEYLFHGKTVSVSTLPDLGHPGMTVRSIYRNDGTLEKVEVLNRHDETVESHNVPASRQVLSHLDGLYTRQATFRLPTVPMPAPQYNSWDHP